MSLFGGSDLPESGELLLPEEEDAVLEKLAKKVVERGMSVPAIIFLESVKPLNYIGSQAMVFFEPIVQTVFNFKDYDTLRSALEKRHTIEVLLLKIEAQDAVALVREKKLKAFLKEEKKKWKWYQRWLGVFTPKVEYPEEFFADQEPEAKGDTK
jgi:hypothetical protein